MRLYLLLLIVMLLPLQVFAQPGNDNCSSAAFLSTDANGNLCINASNLTATNDNFSNACDNSVTSPLTAGGNEVWFSYVAEGSVNTITVTPNGANPAQQLSVTVVNGTCTSLSTNVCYASPTAGGPASVIFTTTAGTLIRFYVTALQSDGEFEVCINSANGFNNPGTNCTNASVICNRLNFTSPGSSISSSAPIPPCFNSPPKRPLWYKFKAGTTGPLEFSASPNGPGGFRWALYDITAGCPGTVVSCNSVYDPSQPFGLSAASVNCTTSPMCPTITVTAGQTYALMVDDTSESGTGFNLNWGSGVEFAPEASFAVDSLVGCGSLTADFNDQSICSNSASWTFDYGDTSPLVTGTGKPVIPSHTYSTGTWRTQLTITEAGTAGCSTFYVQQITVKTIPAAGILISDDSLCYDGTNPVNSNFISVSVIPNTTYDWIFTNSFTSAVTGVAQATASWINTGIFPVSLVITQDGCFPDTVNASVEVFEIPDPSFALIDSGCTGVPVVVQYNGNASPSATYTWTYGGAITSNVSNQSFEATWNATGLYHITLTVEENGCISSVAYDSVTVFATPVINVTTPPATCSGDTITVTPLATGNAGLIYTWDFGSSVLISGSPADASTGDFIFPVSGNSFWTAIGTSAEGCSSLPDSSIYFVNQTPVASFTLSAHQLCDDDTLTATFTGTAGATAMFNWTFTNAAVLTGGGAGPFLVHYFTPGVYDANLVITENGCTSNIWRDTIQYGQAPPVDAGVGGTICSGDSLQLGVTGTAGATYQWTPSDYLSNDTLPDPLVIPLYYGITDSLYRYYLIASSGFCFAFDSVDVLIKARQTADFSAPQSQCLYGNIFSFSTVNPVVNNAQFNWDFGTHANPGTSVNASETVSFDSASTYLVTLITTTPGCPSDSFSVNVTVKESPVASITASDTSGCPPLTITFTNNGPAYPNSSFVWNFGDGGTDTVSAPQYTYNTSGIYLPVLTLTTADTCSVTDTLDQPVIIQNVPSGGFNASATVGSIYGPPLTFSAVDPGSICYFNYGDGTGDSSCFVSHLYSDTGTFTVGFFTSNAAGCSDSAYLDVIITQPFSLYIPNAFSPNNDGLNDRLEIATKAVETFEFSVFNRRGQLIFTTDNPGDFWSGKYLDTTEECPEGVYVYVLKIRDTFLKQHFLNGQINLIR